MDPVTMGLISGGLNLLGGLGARSKAIAAANARYDSQVAFANRDIGVGLNDLKIAFEEEGNALGMALTDLAMEANAVQATTKVDTAERNVYGSTAFKQQAMVEMKEALSADRLYQQAEANIVDLQNKGRQMNYDYQNRVAEAAQARSNAIASQPSTFGLLTGAVSAGMSGYASGLNLQSAQATLSYQRNLSAITANEVANLRKRVG